MFCVFYAFCIALTHSYLEARKTVIGKHADLDQTPHHVASDKGLHCLLTGFFLSKMKNKRQKDRTPLKMTIRLVQHI